MCGVHHNFVSLLSVSPCELHCRPLNEHFSDRMQDAVTDGTPCYEGNKSRDMCVNGICKVSTLYLLFHIFYDIYLQVLLSPLHSFDYSFLVFLIHFHALLLC